MSASTSVNIAVVTPMPRPSMPAAISPKPGRARQLRHACRTSSQIDSTVVVLTSRIASFVWTMPPKSRKAALRASAGDMPRSTFDWISISRWNPSSASSSRATRRRWSRARSRVSIAANIDASWSSIGSGQLEQAANGERELLPVGRLGVQAPPAGGRQSIEPRLPFVLGRRHLGGKESGRFEPMQRWIEGPLTDAEGVPGDLADALLDAPAVIRREGEGLENEEIEGALEILGLRHGLPLVWREKATRGWPGCQLQTSNSKLQTHSKLQR